MQRITRVLPAGYFNAVQQTAINSQYQPMDRNDIESTSIYVSNLANVLEEKIYERMREEIGEFEIITGYLRLNSSTIDTTLRVHSDSEILGQQPTHGCVMGINVPDDTGTGFWDHKEYGDRLPEGKFQHQDEYSDESLWTFRDYEQIKNNDMIIYPSNLFHQRYPTVQLKERLVWVGFIKLGDTKCT